MTIMTNSKMITRTSEENFNDYCGIEKDLIALPVPEKTNYYSPVSYKEVIDRTMENLDKKGFKVLTRRYVTNKDLSRVIAYYGVQSENAELNQQIGWRNSYDKSMSVGFVTGAEVRICSNGLLFGDFSFRKKHQGKISSEFEDAIVEQIDIMHDNYLKIASDLEVMKHKPLTKRHMAELAGRMFIENEIITPNQLSQLKSEIMNPTFDYSCEGYEYNNADLYSFYQHLTFILKDSHPMTNAKQLSESHKFIMEVSSEIA